MVPTCELRIDLDGVQPPIWRTLIVPASIGLDAMHCIIQVAMGWTNSHLHEFRKGKNRYGALNAGGDFDREVEDEGDFCIAELLQRPRQKLVYMYDFGDGWSHTITLLSIRPEPCPVPRCLDGKRACPPEDCGGPGGYENLLKIIGNPRRKEHAEMLAWFRSMVPEGHDPEIFPIEEVNEHLGRGVDSLLDDQAAIWGDEGSEDDDLGNNGGEVIPLPTRN